MDPLPRPPYPEPKPPVIKMTRKRLIVDGVRWDASRRDSAIKNALYVCRCGKCRSCRVGNYLLTNFTQKP